MARPKKLIPFDELPDHFPPGILQKHLGINRQTIYNLLREGKIPARRIGNIYIIIKNEFGRAWGYLPPVLAPVIEIKNIDDVRNLQTVLDDAVRNYLERTAS